MQTTLQGNGQVPTFVCAGLPQDAAHFSVNVSSDALRHLCVLLPACDCHEQSWFGICCQRRIDVRSPSLQHLPASPLRNAMHRLLAAMQVSGTFIGVAASPTQVQPAAVLGEKDLPAKTSYLV